MHGRQEDAHEFLIYLLESLQKCYLLSCRSKENSSLDSYSMETTPFNQIFGGYMRQDIVCLQGYHKSTTLQHFTDLQLEIPQADRIDDALREYFRRESFGQGENLYMCETCREKVPAFKQLEIERPPLVLCIQLKRFNTRGVKIDRPIKLKRKLSMSQHVRQASARGINVEYRLVSVINHHGHSAKNGHYTCNGLAGNGNFYTFNDSSVLPISLSDALNSPAYIIFYEATPATKKAILAPTFPASTSGNGNRYLIWFNDFIPSVYSNF